MRMLLTNHIYIHLTQNTTKLPKYHVKSVATTSYWKEVILSDYKSETYKTQLSTVVISLQDGGYIVDLNTCSCLLFHRQSKRNISL